jgi:hypothetical protein
MTRQRLIAAAAIVFLFIASHTTEAMARVELRRVPDGGVQPQAGIDSKGVIHLIYLTGDPSHSDIGYARSADGGATWSQPIRVNSQAGSALAIGTVRGAQLALGRNGAVHVAWMGSRESEPKAPRGLAPMLYARLSRGSVNRRRGC